MVVGPVEQKTGVRWKNMVVFESYKNAVDFISDSEDVILLDTFIHWKHLISKFLKEVLALKVLITWEKKLNIVDKTVISQQVVIVLSNVLVFSLIRIIRKNIGISLEMKNIGRE